MEDVDLVRRLGMRRLVAFDVAAVTDAARYRRDGYGPRMRRNAVPGPLFPRCAASSPGAAVPGSAMTGRANLIVFVKSPRPGHVKRRLAAGLGPVHAARVYRGLVATLLRRLAGGPAWRRFVFLRPGARRRPAPWPMASGLPPAASKRR